MSRSIFKTSAGAVLIVAVSFCSEAQIARPNDSADISRTADPYPPREGSSAQDAYVSGPGYKSSIHQPQGCISGTILDPTGAVSVGADVHLTIDGQSSDRQIRSGKNGQFVFTNVESGHFRLRVSASGFATREFSATLNESEMYIVPPISLAVAPTVTEVHVKETPLTEVQVADLQIKEQEKQRVLGIIPNFYVSYDADALPISPKQKFRLAWKTTVDPFTFLGVAALAGVEQGANTFDGYGQGAQGYFKRFGASYTDVLTATYIGSAVLPSVLKQDPRYFYKGTGSTGLRFLYALASPFICKGDNRRWQPNYSNMAGAFASAGMSYLYYPEGDRRGAGLVLQNSMIRLGQMAFEGVLQEFVIPRLTPRLHKRMSDQR
jgi:carboxypeptidase family protein